jgi:protoporphyrinogen oxidase
LRIAIIGGGIAGLSAARELLKAGHDVDLFERAPFLGGQVVTFPIGDARLEYAYHHLFTSDTIIRDLMEELGIADSLRWYPSKDGWFKGGRVYPFVSPLDLLRFKPLRPWNRVRLGLVVLFLQRYERWQRLEGTTATRWMRRWAGRNAYRQVWKPLLRGKFGARHEDVSMAWLWGKIHLRTTSRESVRKTSLGYPTGSFQVIVDALERDLRERGARIHTGASVEQILTEPIEGGERLRAVGLRTDEGELRFDRVIATIPSNRFLAIAPPMGEEYERKLKAGQYQGALVMILALKRPLSGTYWMNIGEEDFPFVALIEQTNFVPKEWYGGKHVLYISNYLSTQEPLWRLGDEELFDAYEPYLRRINPEFARDWVEGRWVFREAAAQPIVTPHYSEVIPELQTPVERLILANTTQIYPEDRGTNYSVRLGKQAAEAVTGDEGDEDAERLPLGRASRGGVAAG